MGLNTHTSVESEGRGSASVDAAAPAADVRCAVDWLRSLRTMAGDLEQLNEVEREWDRVRDPQTGFMYFLEHYAQPPTLSPEPAYERHLDDLRRGPGIHLVSRPTCGGPAGVCGDVYGCPRCAVARPRIKAPLSDRSESAPSLTVDPDPAS